MLLKAGEGVGGGHGSSADSASHLGGQGTFHVYSTPKLRQGRTCPRRTSLNYANKLSNMPPAKGSSVKH